MPQAPPPAMHNYPGGGNFPGFQHPVEFVHHVQFPHHMGHQMDPMVFPPVLFPYLVQHGQAHPGSGEGGRRRHRGQCRQQQLGREGSQSLSTNGSSKNYSFSEAEEMSIQHQGQHASFQSQHPRQQQQQQQGKGGGGQTKGKARGHTGGGGNKGSEDVDALVSPLLKKAPKGKKDMDEEELVRKVASGQARTRRRRSRKSKDKQQTLQENIKKTIYVSDIDQQVTEEALATLFTESGEVVDCRVCGDPNSAMRFAFVEFRDSTSAKNALTKSTYELGGATVRVLPSKTAIVPVNTELMPKNEYEMELCNRTIYATNIDKKVDKEDVQRFFEALCGPVGKLRLLGDHAHSTRIAFVEFLDADSALAALSCSGALLGTTPIRVSPSKTPVRFSNQDCKK